MQFSEDTAMSSRAIFYHAGCPVCIDAEQKVALALDKSQYNVEVVHLGQQKVASQKQKLLV